MRTPEVVIGEWCSAVRQAYLSTRGFRRAQLKGDKWYGRRPGGVDVFSEMVGELRCLEREYPPLALLDFNEPECWRAGAKDAEEEFVGQIKLGKVLLGEAA